MIVPEATSLPAPEVGLLDAELLGSEEEEEALEEEDSDADGLEDWYDLLGVLELLEGLEEAAGMAGF